MSGTLTAAPSVVRRGARVHRPGARPEGDHLLVLEGTVEPGYVKFVIGPSGNLPRKLGREIRSRMSRKVRRPVERGLYTACRRRKGELLGKYTGTVVGEFADGGAASRSRDAAQVDADGADKLIVCGKQLINGSDALPPYFSIMNDPRGTGRKRTAHRHGRPSHP